MSPQISNPWGIVFTVKEICTWNFILFLSWVRFSQFEVGCVKNLKNNLKQISCTVLILQFWKLFAWLNYEFQKREISIFKVCCGRLFNTTLLKVPFKRKAWCLRPKSHVILIEIKIEARYLKRNSQTPQGKKPRKFKPIKYIMAFGPITSCFSVEWDFTLKNVCLIVSHQTYVFTWKLKQGR